MNFRSTSRGLLSLIIGSLSLLGIFISFWLHQVYQEEKSLLEKESSFMVSNAINEYESELMQAFINETIERGDQDSLHINNASFQIMMTTTRDSTDIFIATPEQADTNVHVEMNINNHASFHTTENQANDFTTMPARMVDFLNGDSIATIAVRGHFENALNKSDLPQIFQIVKMGNQDSSSLRGILVTEESRFLRDGQFGVSAQNYQPYLLKKMLPEIGFSLLLFSCIGFAFSMIYKNLQHQLRLNEIKKDFVSNITHELKTPITTVGVAMEALSNFNVNNNPEKREEYINISKQELSRLSFLVDKVLTLNEFESTATNLKIESINLLELVNKVVDSFQLQAEKQQATLNVHTVGHQFDLQGDPVHLTNVLYNLIDNALKYSSTSAQIEMVVMEEEHEIQLKISDNGIGIPESYQDKIFDKFFRVPTGDLHNVKGHGLGLSYVANVIQQHQGKIKVESQEGIGSSFKISLPRRHA